MEEKEEESMSLGKYILINKRPVEVTNILLWAKFLNDKDRIVDETEVENYRISTVFLGLDPSFRDGPPLLFETMVFDNLNMLEFLGRRFPRALQSEYFIDRYPTWESAEEGHKKIVENVKQMIIAKREKSK